MLENIKRKVGRPRKEINLRQLRALAMIHCTLSEMAAVLDCSIDTLERNFAAEIDKGREQGKSRLRREQWKAALHGNTTMLIFLGKSILKQVDTIELSGPSGGLSRQSHEYDLSKLTDEELAVAKRISEKLAMPGTPTASNFAT